MCVSSMGPQGLAAAPVRLAAAAAANHLLVGLTLADSSVNPSDRSPTMAINDHYPKPAGSDVSGIIVGTTAGGCKKLKVGDAVWGDIGPNTMTASGSKTKQLGGYAQFAVALDSQLSKIPEGMGLAEAGSLPKVALTSYKALVWYANMDTRPMDERTVLVLGGSGGTGTVGLQLAKKVFNATKVTTTTSADNFDYCRSNGADELIDYKSTNWWEVVPDGSQDIVYDCVGQSATGDYAVKKLKPGGSYVTITGNLAIRVPPGVSQHSFINSDTNLGSANLLEALASFKDVRMTSLKTYNLSDVDAAFAESATGQVKGKLVIKPPPLSEEGRRAALDLWGAEQLVEARERGLLRGTDRMPAGYPNLTRAGARPTRPEP